jgi:hypothetical protein
MGSMRISVSPMADVVEVGYGRCVMLSMASFLFLLRARRHNYRDSPADMPSFSPAAQVLMFSRSFKHLFSTRARMGG